MEIIYRANDGTEFTDEQDCVNYENRMNYLCDKKHFIAFNSDLEPYNITPDRIEGVLEMMEYFICLTDEAVNAFRGAGFCASDDKIEVNVYYGWEMTTSNTWESFSDVLEAINKETERLIRIEDALNKSVAQARGE